MVLDPTYVRMYTREDVFGGKPKTWTMLARTMFIFWFGAYCRAFNCNESLKNYVMHISIMLRIHIYDGLLKYLFSKEFCWLKHAHSVIFYLTNWTETDVADQASPHMRPIPLHDRIHLSLSVIEIICILEVTVLAMSIGDRQWCMSESIISLRPRFVGLHCFLRHRCGSSCF